MRFQDKVAVISGAVSSIGQAIAHAMVREGAKVVISDINVQGVNKLASEICTSGGTAVAIKADISKQDEVEHMVERVMSQFGRVDILVNNAAANFQPKPFTNTQMAEWRAEIDVTLIGTISCCKAVLAPMLKQKSGRIINISSDSGKIGIPKMTIYSCCKAGIAGFSRALAQELATEGITINCISPGPVETKLVAEMFKKQPSLKEAWLANVPARRLGKPEEIASMVVYLASDEAAWITGQDYSINGGARM